MGRREEHPDRVFEREMAELDEVIAREERAEREARHAPALAPLADARTGRVSIPTTWNTLAWGILHGQEPSATVIECARQLAQMVLDASEQGR